MDHYINGKNFIVINIFQNIMYMIKDKNIQNTNVYNVKLNLYIIMIYMMIYLLLCINRVFHINVKYQ